MNEFRWLDHMPSGTLEGGIELANRLYWNITWAGNDQIWCVWSGESLILRTDSQEVAEAFLYGLGLAYGILPREVFEHLAREVRQLIEPDDTRTLR